MGRTLDPRLIPEGDAWCDCPDAPWAAPKPATLLDHSPDCGFPAVPCSVRAHRVAVHKGCGREMPYRFCECSPSGYTWDTERGWWVHYVCGWPTRSWFEAAGAMQPAHLLGVRPVTLHEYVGVPRSTSATSHFSRLTDEQRAVNAAFAGAWVRD